MASRVTSASTPVSWAVRSRSTRRIVVSAVWVCGGKVI
jgi:hypothetical protein